MKTGSRFLLRLAAATTTAAVISGLTLLPAHAGTPFVGEVRTALGSVNILGSDGRSYQISLELQASTPLTGATQNQLTISTAQCNSFGDCGATSTYLLNLPGSAAAFGTDVKSATVRTVFAGAPLVVGWNANTGGINLAGGVDPPDKVYFSNPADGGGGNGNITVSVWHLNCSGGNASTTDDYYFGTYGAPTLSGGPAPKASPGWARPQRRRTPHCAPPQD